MRPNRTLLLSAMLASGLIGSALAAGPTPTKHLPAGDQIDPQLAARLALARSNEPVAVIIHHPLQVDLDALRQTGLGDRVQAHATVTQTLQAHYAATLAPLEAKLRQLGGTKISALWASNSVAVTLPASAMGQLRSDPAVGLIKPDSVINASPMTYSQLAPSEWNIAAVNAPAVWNLGYSGQGTVVGILDTGADPLHQDLIGRYRGGAASWYDPYGQHTTKPYDASGHGTSVTSLVVGGNADGTDIGIAPGAQWIAARVFNDSGAGLTSSIHLAMQWMLNPDGNPATADFPNAVNASWNIAGAIGVCNTEFEPDIQALRASEIAVVFAAGNDGPASSSSDSPGNNPGALPIGAVDQTKTVASFSSRGPSACDGSLFPAVSAPGVNIKAADLTYGGIFPNSYANVSGTTPATAHVTGAMAVLQGAFPTAKVADIEAAILASALPLGSVGANNNTGAGQLDVLAAYNVLLKTFSPSAPAHLSSTGLTAVSYNSSTKAMTVQATSALGKSAAMKLVGYGSMTWSATKNVWSITAKTASVPAIVTISALDGTRSFSTTPGA